MIRPNLLAWQWSDYPAKHRDRVNLLLHVVAVPLFLVGKWITFPRFVLTGAWSRSFRAR